MKCVIFGYGYMGRIRHEVLRRRSDIKEIVIVDPQIDASEVSGTLLRSADELKWDSVDAAFVCTPNDVTADLCIESLNQCGRVFCEKPPGRNWEDFRRIEEAAVVIADHVLSFGFNHRLHPCVQSAKAMVNSGQLGGILYLKGTYGKSGGARYRENWRNDRARAGGGILLDQGIHMLDIFQSFLGPLAVVEAVLSDSFWGCGVEDNAFVLMRTHSGVPAFLHSSATLWRHTFNFEIGCSEGYLVSTGLLSKTGSYGREQLVIGKRQFEDEALALGNPREEIIHFDRDESWDKEVHEFISAIKEARSCTHGTLDEARSVMQIIRDAYAISERRNGVVYR